MFNFVNELDGATEASSLAWLEKHVPDGQWVLQARPWALGAATLCTRGCNHMYYRLQPSARELVSMGAHPLCPRVHLTLSTPPSPSCIL